MESATGSPDARTGDGGPRMVLSQRKRVAAAVLCLAGVAGIGCLDKRWNASIGAVISESHPSFGGVARGLSVSPLDSIPKVNTAVILVKPHAGTDAVMRHIQKRLRAEKVQVMRRGRVPPESIRDFLMQSSGAGVPAMEASPGSLSVTDAGRAAFLAAFGKKWEDALADDTFRNADETLGVTDLTAKMLYDKWMMLKPGKTMVKLLSDVYVGKIDGAYVINGNFPAQANTYGGPDAELRFLEVQWKPARLSYANFTSHVIGGTDDPAASDVSSIRHLIYQNWERMGLESQPDALYNSVIASTSAYAAWLDATSWTMQPPELNFFGKSLAQRNVDIATAAFGAGMAKTSFVYKNKEATLTDHLTGLDRAECLAALSTILPPGPP